MSTVLEPRPTRAGADRRRRLGIPVAIVAVGAITTAVAVGHPIVAVAAGAALVALLIADRPSMATLVAVGLIFSNAVVVGTTEHGVPQLFAGLVPLLFLVAIGHRVCIQHRPLVLPLATPWIVVLFVIEAIGAASSREPAFALGGVGTFLLEGLLLWLFVANAARASEVLRLAALLLVVVGALLSLLSLGQRVASSESNDYYGFAQVSNAVVAKDEASGKSGEKRHAGPIGEQNRWGQSLALVVPLAVALAATDRSKLVRIASALGGVAIGTGVVLTYSRGAAVGLGLAALVAVLLKWVPRAATIGAAVAVIFVLTVVAPVFTDRASTVVTARGSATGQAGASSPDDGSSTDGSFSNRSTEASAAIAVFIRHPVVGVGPGLFPTYFQDEARRLDADRIVGVDREAHNLYLGLAAETGILGFLAFGGAMASILGPLAATRKRLLVRRPDLAGLATGYAMSLVVYLTTGLFLHFAYIRYFWLFAGLAAAMGLVREGQPGADEEPVGAVGAGPAVAAP